MKDILKIIMNSDKNVSSAMDIQFYHNLPWIFFIECISKFSFTFQKEMYNKIHPFIEIVSELIKAAKLQFNYTSHQQSYLEPDQIFQHILDQRSQGIIQSWFDAHQFQYFGHDVENGVRAPYGYILDIESFCDAHVTLNLMHRFIQDKMEKRLDVNTSIALTISFEALKIMRTGTIYQEWPDIDEPASICCYCCSNSRNIIRSVCCLVFMCSIIAIALYLIFR